MMGEYHVDAKISMSVFLFPLSRYYLPRFTPPFSCHRWFLVLSLSAAVRRSHGKLLLRICGSLASRKWFPGRMDSLVASQEVGSGQFLHEAAVAGLQSKHVSCSRKMGTGTGRTTTKKSTFPSLGIKKKQNKTRESAQLQDNQPHSIKIRHSNNITETHRAGWQKPRAV